MQCLIRAQWPQDNCGRFFLPEELIITINGGIQNHDSCGARTPNWIIRRTWWTSAVAAGIIGWNVFTLWVEETVKICCFVFKSVFSPCFVPNPRGTGLKWQPLFSYTTTGVVPGRCRPAPWSSLPPGIKQILTTPISSAALKDKVSSAGCLQRGPQLAPRRRKKGFPGQSAHWFYFISYLRHQPLLSCEFTGAELINTNHYRVEFSDHLLRPAVKTSSLSVGSVSLIS